MKKVFSPDELAEFSLQLNQSLERLIEFEPRLSDADYRNKLCDYGIDLVKTNGFLNLTAITKPEEVAELHFLDSLTIHQVLLDSQKNKSTWQFIDVGTGAGFPSLPNHILFNNLQSNQENNQLSNLESRILQNQNQQLPLVLRPHLTLLDSLQKRLLFLQRIVELTALNEVELLHSRAEDAGQNPAHRDRYDVAVARAVAPMPVLSELCLPFVKVGGLFVAMKGTETDLVSATRALKVLGAEVYSVKELNLPISGAKRHIITIIKTKSTPHKYPRQAGKPKASPL